MQSTWQQIQDILRKTLSPGLFKVWITPLKVNISGNQLTVLAPNDFVASWVKDRLTKDIKEAASVILGSAPELRVRVAEEQSEQSDQRVIVSPIAGKSAKSGKNNKAPYFRQMGLPLITESSQALKNNAPRAWQFSFDDFVVGPGNELAYAAAKGLCNKSIPSDQLFISSAPGLGKTHLLQAVGKHLSTMSNKRNVRVEYLTGEEFARHMIFALRAGEIERFKARFRDSVDILLLEDIHFFQGKEKTQDELLSTLKCLQAHGSKVIFSSSFLPKELKKVDSQLVSRFCSGFLTLIEKPDFDTRKRIIEHKAKKFQAILPENVMDILADRIRTDVRQLESCLQNLILKAKLLNRSISTEMAMDVLENYESPYSSFSIDNIIDFVCESYALSLKQLSSKSRQRQIVLARNTAFYLARQHTDLSLKDIGNHFNRRHSTVLKAITNVEREINLETPLGRQLTNTIDRLGSFNASGPAHD